MKYYVRRAGELVEVETTETGVRIAGREARAQIGSVPGSDRRHLLIGERGVPLSARRTDDGWAIEIYGRTVQLSLEDQRTHTIRELAPPHGVHAPREVRAPMAGLVLRVEVEEGQRVQAGTGLLVIEAMKMENEIRAEAAGTVATIAVAEGQAVNPDDLLLAFAGEEGE